MLIHTKIFPDSYVHTVYRQGTYIYVHNQEIEYFQETVLLIIQERKSIFVELL